MKREKALTRWRRQAKILQRQVESLERLIIDKTGMSSFEHLLLDGGKIYISSPRSSVKIAGLEIPCGIHKAE